MLALGAVFDKEVYSSTKNNFIQFYRIDVDYAVNAYKDTYDKYIM